MAKRERAIPGSIKEMPPLIEQQLLRRFLGWSSTTFARRKLSPSFPKPCKFCEGRSGLVYFKKDDVIEWWDKLNSDGTALSSNSNS